MTGRTYAALDLETTGLDSRRDEIIEVGIVRFRDAGVLDTFQTLVCPTVALPFEIQVLTGILPADLKAAPRFAAVAAGLEEFLRGCTLVGQNAGFDLAFLAAQGLELKLPVFDTLDLAKILAPYLTERNLTALAGHFGVEYETKHRALPDAHAAKGVFLALQEQAAALDLKVLGSLVNVGARSGWALTGFFQDIVDDKLRVGLEASLGGALPPPPVRPPQPLPLPVRPAPRAREFSGERGERSPIDEEALATLLGPQGLLAQQFPGFEHRTEQVAMLRAVTQALNDGDHLLVEAGTGTGKSMAYLLPALFYAFQNDTQVVVSTNTIALQEQIIGKDLPAVLEALRAGEAGGLPSIDGARFTQLKGRGNYLCPRRWQQVLTGSLTIDAGVMARITVWLGTTTTGDRAEININGFEAAQWARVSAASENCPGNQCQAARERECFLQRARKRAAEAHILVVNHALLVSDMSAGNKVLPEFDHLVVDEAHHLEDVATDQLGFRTSPRDYVDFLDRLYLDAGGRPQGYVPDVEAAVRVSSPLFAVQGGMLGHLAAIRDQAAAGRTHVERLFTALTQVLRHAGEGSAEYGRRLRLTSAVRRHPAWSQVEAAWEDVRLVFQDIQHQLERVHTALEPLESSLQESFDDLMAETAAIRFTGDELLDQGNAVIARADPEWVAWLTTVGQEDGVGLFAAPLEVGPRLQKELFNRKTTVVLTSATLRTGPDFEYIKSRLGLERPRELAVESTFPYSEAALLLLPQDVPDPQHPTYGRMLEQALTELCQASGGRALVLFTSYSALQTAHRALTKTLAPAGLTVLAQGASGSIPRMLDRLRRDPATVVLGTSSFWEGVDVVGDALSLLVITRLPFTVPSDPVFAARSELFEDPFRQYAVPQAVIRFRQGFGRLIRSKTDRGVCVVLDKRIAGRSYGNAFLDPLPPVGVERCLLREAPGHVTRWLGRPR